MTRSLTDIGLRLTALVRDEAAVELKTRSQEVFYVTRRLSDDGMTYSVFPSEQTALNNQNAIGFCSVSKITNGISTIANAEVLPPYQRKGIATAVYDLITSDMLKIGALLWPVSPQAMSDAEFKIWWRRSPALVFYYPHRQLLGLTPRAELEELVNQSLNRGIIEKFFSHCTLPLSRVLRSIFGRK